MKNLTNKGFTLLETLVAIAMLTIVMTVVTGMIQTSLQSDKYAKDQITAKYLAEEGIEYIRNIRDQNSVNNISGQPWLYNVAQGNLTCGDLGSATNEQTCTVDPIAGGTPSTCDPAGCVPLRYDESTGEYSYNTNFPVSKFTRTISVRGLDGQQNGQPNAAYSAVVHSTVTWKEGVNAYTYTADEYLFDWYSI